MSLLRGKSQFGLMSRLALALALPLSAPLVARAQNPAETQQEDSATTAAQSNPAQGGDASAANLLLQLNLKPEQIEQMKEIRRQSAHEVQTLTQRRRQARRALDEALYSNALDDATIDQRTRELAESQAALVRLEAQTQLRIRRVLTPDQLQMFRDLRKEAQRNQRIERRLERGVNNPQALRNNPNRRNGQNSVSPTVKPGSDTTNANTSAGATKEARPNAPAGRLRDTRPFAFPRQRRRRQ